MLPMATTMHDFECIDCAAATTAARKKIVKGAAQGALEKRARECELIQKKADDLAGERSAAEAAAVELEIESLDAMSQVMEGEALKANTLDGLALLDDAVKTLGRFRLLSSGAEKKKGDPTVLSEPTDVLRDRKGGKKADENASGEDKGESGGDPADDDSCRR